MRTTCWRRRQTKGPRELPAGQTRRVAELRVKAGRTRAQEFRDIKSRSKKTGPRESKAPGSLYGASIFFSAAFAAENFRSRWESVRGAPVFSSQASPIDAPHVVQGTESTSLAVRCLVFTRREYAGLHLKDVQNCSFVLRV
jgi:hypothetical protein